MKLTNEIFSNQTRISIDKLKKYGGKLKDMKLFMSIVKLISECDRLDKRFSFAHSILVEEYCDRKDGKTIFLPNGVPKISENGKEFLTKQKELLNQEIEFSMDIVIIDLKENPGILSMNGGPLLPEDVAALINLIDFKLTGE